MTDTSNWLPRLRDGLLAMKAHEDPRLREIASLWLGALGALVVSLEAAGRQAQMLRGQANHDFTLGLQRWMLTAGAADPETSAIAREAIDQLLARTAV